MVRMDGEDWRGGGSNIGLVRITTGEMNAE